MISAVNNYISNTPVNADFFECIVLMPAIGHIVQIWKTIILAREYTAIDPKECTLRSNKAYEIRSFNKQSYECGWVADIFVFIAGVVLTGSTHKIGGHLTIAASIISLMARQHSTGW